LLRRTVQVTTSRCDHSYCSTAHTDIPGIRLPSFTSAVFSPTVYTSYRLGSIPGHSSGRRSVKSSSAARTRSGATLVSRSISTFGIGLPFLGWLLPKGSRRGRARA